MNRTYELVEVGGREQFLLDLWRAKIRLSKHRFQTRGQKVIVLVRLDLDGAPHTNPDGTKIEGTHLHLYREGYEDKWAYALDNATFRDPTNIQTTFADFCVYCSIQSNFAFQNELII